jgi:hypothetical protein
MRGVLIVEPDGAYYFMERIWIPVFGDPRKVIMDETHRRRYSIHPGANKMYRDLKEYYWLPGMKTEVADCVNKCLTCSKVKGEH